MTPSPHMVPPKLLGRLPRPSLAAALLTTLGMATVTGFGLGLGWRLSGLVLP